VGANSSSTTQFLATQGFKDLGKIENFPLEPDEQHAFLTKLAIEILAKKNASMLAKVQAGRREIRRLRATVERRKISFK